MKFLKVEKFQNGYTEKFIAYLTEDRKSIDGSSRMEVEVNHENKTVTSKVQGEFLKDFDLKLEAILLMNWLR